MSLIGVISQVLMARIGQERHRSPAYETMVMTPGIENHIRQGQTFKINSAIQTGKQRGMHAARRPPDGPLLNEGKIDQRTALLKCQDPRSMRERLGLIDTQQED